jgi:hypothetical protein
MTTVRRLLAVMFLLGMARPALAQDDFEKWQAAEQRKYQQFLSEQDQAFTDFLKKAWTPVRTTTLKEDTVPKPRTLPAATPRTAVQPASELPSAIPVLPGGPRTAILPPFIPAVRGPNASPSTVAAMPAANTPSARALPATLVSLEAPFFGASIPVLFDTAALPRLTRPLSGKVMAEAFESLARSEHSVLLETALEQKKELGLSDWAYSRLLSRISRDLYPANDGRAEVLTWFLLLKSGYLAKLGYVNDRVWVLFSSSVQVYNTPSFRSAGDGPRFYAMSLDGEPANDATQLYTYAGDYAGATRAIEFRMTEPPRFPERLVWRTVKVSDRGVVREIKVPLNANLLSYLERYPRLDQDAYFGGGLSPSAWRALDVALRPLVTGRSELEAVNLLLHFVQNAFAYQTDDEQFRRDKPFFADETLYYPASDCEDRAVLFATLVRRLLNLEVIGLDYPGHVATAVRFRTAVPGAAVTHNGARFVISDPTYINADVGMVMPQYANVAPKPIPVP